MSKPIDSWLSSHFSEVTPFEFYRDLFPSGELEKKGERVQGEYCGIAIQVVGKNKAKRFSVTDDLEIINELVKTDDFCVMSPVSYAGKRQSQSYARFLYAVAIDLDEIIIEGGYAQGLEELYYQMTAIRNTASAKYAVPLPSYIVSSGSGVHLYYMLEKPIPLFKNVIEQLVNLRHALIVKSWNEYVTMLSDNKQFESVTQGFRMVGTVTKSGDRVRAFKTGPKVTMEYLNEHVSEKNQVTRFSYRSKLTLEQAKKKYPEWYDAYVVGGKRAGTWTVKRDLYDWWKRKIMAKDGGAIEGHRYFCIMALAVFAMKCGIEYEELEADALSFVDDLNERGNKDTNPFTVSDVMKALEAYNANYQTFPRKNIERMTAIAMPANKRNGRKQVVHLAGARAVQEINDKFNGTNWREGNGRKPKRELVQNYAAAHPEANHSEIARALGISRPTVIKWLKHDINVLKHMIPSYTKNQLPTSKSLYKMYILLI